MFKWKEDHDIIIPPDLEKSKVVFRIVEEPIANALDSVPIYWRKLIANYYKNKQIQNYTIIASAVVLGAIAMVYIGTNYARKK